VIKGEFCNHLVDAVFKGLAKFTVTLR